MKEFSQVVRVVPISVLPDNYSGTATEILDRGYQFHADHFVLDPRQSESSGGVLYNCDQEHIIDNPATRILVTPTSSIVIYSAGDDYILIGTKEVPARVFIQPHLNRSRLIIKCNMLKSPV